jgi:hypothetical protein
MTSSTTLWSAPAERSGDGALAGSATGAAPPKAKAASLPPQSKSFDFETLCKSFIAPRRVLRVLTDFILFTRKDDELSKVVLRPHQMQGTERCVARARDKKKKRGLVWHTQGSGKTYTMIVTAKLLIQDPFFENPTVILLVDRNELEAQSFGNLEAVGFEGSAAYPGWFTDKRSSGWLWGADCGLLLIDRACHCTPTAN